LVLTLFSVRFHEFPGAQIFIYKRLLINSRKCFDDGVAAEQQNVVCTLAAWNFDWWTGLPDA